MQPASLRVGRCVLIVAGVLCQAGPLPREDTGKLSPPPDFNQSSIGVAAGEVVAAWTNWRTADKELETQVFRQPMVEGRELLRRRLGDFQGFLDKRRAYSESVLAYLDKRRTEPRSGQPDITLAEVYRGHIYELGMHLAVLRERLSALREYPEWTQVRRGIQPESDLAFRLQSLRRSEMPLDLSLKESNPPAAVTSLAYRNLDQQLMDQLSRLWTRYYQALDDALEQKPRGAAPLTPIGKADSAAPVARVPEIAHVAQPSVNPLAGTWTYAERSQKFNGVAEPRNVLLELWIENGLLLGRYRAELPDFQGNKRVDLRLHGPIAPAGTPQTLDFESREPIATGQIVIEGPGSGGLEVMVDRRVPPGSAIPRGRELLKRR